MASIRIYTDPTLTLTLKDIDIHSADHVIVTLSDHTGSRIVEKDEDDITMSVSGSDTVIAVPFTQNETKLFRANTKASLEVNWIIDGVRDGSDIKYDVNVLDNLHKEIMS